jgi:tetratricopeptide (TPR) repeat protein
MRALTLVPFLLLLSAFTGTLRADDGVIDRAIELEKTGNGAAALTLLENHLAQDPADNEARIRYGIILSWEKRRDDARKQLELVLAASPDNYDALFALINVELWTDHPIRAEELAKRALVKHPDDRQGLPQTSAGHLAGAAGRTQYQGRSGGSIQNVGGGGLHRPGMV